MRGRSLRTSGLPIRIDVDAASQRRIERALLELPEKVYRKVVSKAVRYGARVLVKAARARVPERTGLLRRSLGVKVKSYAKGHVVFAVVGAREGFKDPATGENPINIAHLVEYGTAPHQIRCPEGGAFKIGGVIFRGTIQHPGSRPQPFIRPAFDQAKGTVVRRYREKLLKGIEAETKKLGRV